MRSLCGHGRTGCQVQPLTTDLPQGIGTSLGERAVVFVCRAGLGVHHRSQGGEQCLPCLGIQVPVHPHHATQGGRGGKTPARPELGLSIRACLGLDRLAPVPHDPG
jgi:hypothetical protein